ncbi:hypothetical protein OK016_26150 [Vibrio chagasii]|nr:hypothetical protein [Vibrio chagasii]
MQVVAVIITTTTVLTLATVLYLQQKTKWLSTTNVMLQLQASRLDL